MLCLLLNILCSKYDLYSKSKETIDVEKVKPYYLSLIEKVRFSLSDVAVGLAEPFLRFSFLKFSQFDGSISQQSWDGKFRSSFLLPDKGNGHFGVASDDVEEETEVCFIPCCS